jgi:hypothetical protein
MKLALIPPFAYAAQMLRTDYQLVLPECFRNEHYTRVVYNMRMNDPKVYNAFEQFIILDNGAAEGNAWHPQALMAIGREFRVSEIVIPDELGDLEITLDMLEFFEDNTSEEDRSQFGFMGVVQGGNIAQIGRCAEAFADKDYVTTVGIPRHLLDTLGDKHARIQIYAALHGRFGNRFQFHFL